MERIKTAIDKARLARPVAPFFGPERAARAANGALQPLQPLRSARLDPAHLERHRVIATEPSHPARWSFDILRTQVLQHMTENGWKTLAITSPTVNSGKTVVAINLAMSIAHHPQHSSVLVDFDLRRPRVAEYLGLGQGTSLEDVLGGRSALEAAAVDVGLPKFCVIPTEKPVASASEVLSSDRALQVLAQLRSGALGSITIFDLPPVTAVDDVIAVLPRIDCVLVVIGNGMSTKHEIDEAQRHLARYNVLGTVLNKAAPLVRNDGYY